MASRAEAAWDNLVGDLYLAAVDQAAAARVAPALSRLLSAGTGAVWAFDGQTGALAGPLHCNFAPENMALYAEHWYAYDPWTLPLAQQGIESVVRGGQLIEDSKLLRHPFYAEYGVNTGHFHVMGAILLRSGQSNRVGCIAVQRPFELGAFSDAEYSLLERLVPHAQRAQQLDARLRSDLAPLLAGRAALDGLPTAAIALRGTGVVVHANAAAERLDRETGVVLLRRPGEDRRIAAHRSADTAWLRDAIADAAQGGAGGAKRLRGKGEDIYAAVVTPLPRRLADQGELGCLPGMALLTLKQIEPLTLDRHLEEMCIKLFGFTRAEAQAAVLLAAGTSPEDIAETRDVRISTVRTLLNRAMDKSGAQNLRRLATMLTLLAR